MDLAKTSTGNILQGGAAMPPASTSSVDNSRFRLPSLPPPGVLVADALHARRRHTYHTWAQTYFSRPQLWLEPQAVAEVQKAIVLAHRHRRRLVAVGAGHSPSDLTCSSSWMAHLGRLDKVLAVERYERKDGVFAGRVLIEAGITLEKLNLALKEHGLVLPNIGSIHVQSFAGAIATATHGSSLHHGALPSIVRGLRIVLASGEARWCSPDEDADLFHAALVSLGALGIITEVCIEVAQDCNIEWQTSLHSLDEALERWDTDWWTECEYTRCWWMPYQKRIVRWTGDKTSKALRPPGRAAVLGGAVGYHLYQAALWLANCFPSLGPLVEWIGMGSEHRFSLGQSNSGIDELRTGLLMNCLYSQNVNEWALPLAKGPEAIRALSEWLLGGRKDGTSELPFDASGIYAHAPIEVRVSDGSRPRTRALLDPSMPNEPTLYLNATLYRPYGWEAPWKDRYYYAFEQLMKRLGGRPHWAKNFSSVSAADLDGMYGDNLAQWRAVRARVDGDGVFAGAWHRRTVLGGDGDGDANADTKRLPNEEVERAGSGARHGNGVLWEGRQAHEAGGCEGLPDEVARQLVWVDEAA